MELRDNDTQEGEDMLNAEKLLNNCFKVLKFTILS